MFDERICSVLLCSWARTMAAAPPTAWRGLFSVAMAKSKGDVLRRRIKMARYGEGEFGERSYRIRLQGFGTIFKGPQAIESLVELTVGGEIRGADATGGCDPIRLASDTGPRAQQVGIGIVRGRPHLSFCTWYKKRERREE